MPEAAVAIAPGGVMAPGVRPRPLQPVRRDHLLTLSADGPIAQHAVGIVPDPAHGSCTDDVARALEVDLLHADALGWPAVADTAWRSAWFLGDALDPTTHRFRNFRSAEGQWLEPVGSEDSQGRAMLALGWTIEMAPEARLREVAASLFLRALPAAAEVGALRARCSVLLGCDRALRGGLDGDVRLVFALLAGRVVETFEPAVSAADWPWPEPVLTYESALPARALIVAGDRLGEPAIREMGLDVLRWLTRSATTDGGHLSPVGNDGWWPRTGVRARFDQQPIEAAALVLASEAALEATGDPRHADDMERAYGWFLGANDLGIALADPDRGGCHDGLREHDVNPNQGAESTLAWLASLEHIRRLRRRTRSLLA